MVSAGPFVIIDRDVEKETSHPGSEPQPTAEATDSMQSDGPESVEPIVPGEPVSRGKVSPRSAAVVHQEPGAGRVGDATPEEMNSVFHDVPEHRPSTAVEEPFQETSTNAIDADGANVQSPLAATPPHREAEAAGQDPGTKTGPAGLGFPRAEAVDAGGQDDLSPREDQPPPRLDANDHGAVIRSKLQFTKAADGTQTLSYEEELVKPNDDCVAPGCGRKMHQELRKRRKLRATFLDFLRSFCFFSL